MDQLRKLADLHAADVVTDEEFNANNSALNDYLKQLRSKALVLQYVDDAELMQQVETVLSQAVARDQGRAQIAREATPHAESIKFAEVWPRVEVKESTATGNRGQVRTSRNCYLVLSNTGSATARNVRVSMSSNMSNMTPEDDDPWSFRSLTLGDGNEEVPVIEFLAPGGEARFNLPIVMGSPGQVNCTVSWEDDRDLQQNTATLRLS
jgi:hypothetical protein